MGDTHTADDALLILAAFGRDPRSLDWARREAERAWGAVALASDRFDFSETDYYEQSMGRPLKKEFLAFERTIDPGRLPRIKCQTHRWEEACAVRFHGDETAGVVRPLNLDPGYLTQAKLVLASTKDHAHRIYLADGIYGEVTLRFRAGAWKPWDWTYPDYRREDYHHFFSACRDYFRARRGISS